MTSDIDTIVTLSREFGSDPRYVIAGGGNSSVKNKERMLVKASGSRMGTIGPEGFALIDLGLLNRIWEKTYPLDKAAREEAVLADLMASRCPGEESKRPSVETLLHALFPERFVMHTHPALVNGITCSVEGERAVRKLFGDTVLWVKATEPGYILAKAVRDVLKDSDSQGKPIFLENHGIFVTGNSEEEVRSKYFHIFDTIDEAVEDKPEKGIQQVDDKAHREISQSFAAVSDEATDPVVLSFMDRVLEPFIKNRQAFSVFEKPFTPDHIVYAGFRPLFVESLDKLIEELQEYKKSWGELPKIIGLKNRSCFAVASSKQRVEDARDLFLDAAMIAVYCRSFGGPSFLSDELIDFIRTWEVEKYRQKQA
jgi:rhamnose utilization protein RhaD (predicted bifunctional aldolase and dehydrogenase)